MKKLLASCLILIIAVSAVMANGQTEEKSGYTFGYTCMTMNNPFFIALEGSIRETVEANGDRLITMDPAMDVAKQINQIDDLIVQGIDAIYLNPVDWEGVRPALVALEKAGIPIINFDAEVKDIKYVTSYAGSDNNNAGFVCGQDLVARFPDGGNIVVLDSPTMNSINDRISGFMNAIDGKGFNIVAQQDGKGDLPTSMEIMDDILQAHSDIIAIMGGNDPTALGALAACKSANRTDILIYGVDGSPEAKSEIASGSQFVGSGAQSPISIGLESVKLSYQILKGESYETRVPVKTFLINEENVGEYGTDGWQ
ncbi:MULTISPECIES: sugar ABC transporter substrate-binding protein [unclassified Oceanispirochaeta]|uniref:sugar ABC transporter substrate-binding protein n=1 Tax=unclassified Oceanispirochaeta TaxID=2635722 RepID=UPI000E09A1DE|nr:MULTISPECIES: sugar ABC transporter substrate-binding protein [unclassified Oceanispirochaeta]MBF9014611.1 sugar ABC transporter substrate-binding protein [Oceanispirochaeta sp. M2]NPD70867.1 sugar ABC transporter substrate-binding protein [Oceanispirochaeta sp. M1]RDG34146.1 sugar ABC transporter substrate-binding protein [Oceanispirochaeta sp. M1]